MISVSRLAHLLAALLLLRSKYTGVQNGATPTRPRPLFLKMSVSKELFISYGREPQVNGFVVRLKADLERNGFTVWLDLEVSKGILQLEENGIATLSLYTGYSTRE